jgi:hypothetical protein
LDETNQQSEHEVAEADKPSCRQRSGKSLIKICRWAGARAAEGDEVSIRLLREYISIFLGAVQPAQVSVIHRG